VGKRLFDAIASLLALTALSPLLLAIAGLIKLDSPGPVFFRQQRLGRGARPFTIYKFRTMRAGASTRGPRITVHADPRVTRVGRVLRRFDLDELPTLLNVLRGEMSLVGPRPELPEYLPYYTEEQKQVLTVRPGLTDPGTLAFRNEAVLLDGEHAEDLYTREILPRKLAFNLDYVRNRSLLSDAAILVRTLAAVVLQSKG
jgi:lipopolysaccharide/colanic/teichoic acid biosynthesis glycosyltransferase